ncbi:DUF2537 domain-containing protein [Amycolatopsis endophytica]|uniref:DUF2537 domain-containing protein n=1 Tax=Amycolatopsis endophytica TaxID=860233 RepID=A0A853B2K9_9PSEU|nr:DUF2537 domain-containing protein [Amycolatopsis endophytica]NYI89240.1 hypothetical protein [Amycolatopsis endophytica]
MELRVRGDRAVLKGHGELYTREIDPHSLALGVDLADALHEWAQVAAALRRSANDPNEAGTVVSRRGQQLASRVASVMGTPVHYVDPVTGEQVVVPPPPPSAKPRRLFAAVGDEPTPWGTGLIVAGFVAAVVIVAMMALAIALAAETAGWLVLVAAVVVTGGIAPSLWLARKLPIIRWIALGAAGGVVISWIGVLGVVF